MFNFKKLTMFLLLFSPLVSAQEEVSFVEYEAVTEFTKELAAECKRALQSNSRMERCDEFHQYLDDRYEPLSNAFMDHFQREGAEVFSGVDAVRMETHKRTQERLTRDIYYITERLR
ncbi:hypothetical protein [Vreelandella neptunia]|uniref:hypothetical protein n=1 Tax=Vreelandella neptunia TaxID=115551 RepID=UPI00315B0388